MGSASPSVSKGVIRPSILEGAGLAGRRRGEASGHGRGDHHPVSRRAAARARAVQAARPGRERDRPGPRRDGRAVPLRQIAAAAVLRRLAQDRALPRPERARGRARAGLSGALAPRWAAS